MDKEILEKKLENIPSTPGVYQFKDQNGKIIYIGKAKNLRNRVRSYFQATRNKDAKTVAMIKKISDVEFTIVNSEAEALILEDSLVKQYKPHYNIMLRDDKTYPFVKISNELFPQVIKTRNVVKDGSKYFGPFTDVRHLNMMLILLRNLLQFRSCRIKFNERDVKLGKYRVCLDYHIGKCCAPCAGYVDEEEYLRRVKLATQVFQGKTRDFISQIKDKMDEYSQNLQFEEAAKLRDNLANLKNFFDSQKTVSNDFKDLDVFAYYTLEKFACVLIFVIREGKIIRKKHYIIPNADKISKSDCLRACIENWYMNMELIPEEILIDEIPEDSEFIINWLKDIRKRTVHFHVPKLGEKKKILDVALINSEFMLREHLLAIAKRDNVASKPVQALQKDLNLPKIPNRIECFDNSHIQGSDYVSSMVCFIDGKPRKSEYRKYKLRDIDGNDDFAAMREVISRRYSAEAIEKSPLPDLIIIDGGKGQLSSAVEILTELGHIDKVTVIGLAKRLEEVFFPGISESTLLPKTSISLKLIQKLRDEAHRFAITYHRLLRDKRTLHTELTDIPGIGETIANKLLTEFGSIKNLTQQTYEEIARVAGRAKGKAIYDYFHGEESE